MALETKTDHSGLSAKKVPQSFPVYLPFGKDSLKGLKVCYVQPFIYCSDFRYESNGIFVLGVGFFSSDKFRLFN